MKKEIKYYPEIVQDEEFRQYVNDRISDSVKGSTYSLFQRIPLLYKYRAISDYAVDDIINGQITLSAIGEFNDMFDGSIHRYGTTEEQKSAALKKWEDIDNLTQKLGLPQYLKKDEFVENFERHFKEDSRLKFGLLNNIGTYVCCLSSKNDSVLMWSHYADSSQGMCIGYDFNGISEDTLLKKIVFPIAYTDEPLDLSDLLDDDKNQIFKYPIDAAVQCAALTKSKAWEYEHEWRVILVLSQFNNSLRRIQTPIQCAPLVIHFGFHFLKPFFYYDDNEYSQCENKVKNFMRLLDYMIDNSVKATVMIPEIGGYRVVPKHINVTQLKVFMFKHFSGNQPETIRYYDVIQDYLLDLLERENNNVE